jgi:hypothetical protein
MLLEVRQPRASETAKRPSKKSYQKPTLTQYGKAKDLTTAGPGTAREASPGKKPR